MANCSSLDEQGNILNALHSGCARALDNFADTSKAIAERARRISNDVQQWEMAQGNIASTIEEMSRAARCYHPPFALRNILSRKEKNPDAVCKCIDYLIFTENYLRSHPTNLYADQILSNISTQLESIVKISEDIIKEAFINALKKQNQGENRTTVGERGVNTPFLLFVNPKALEGIEKIVHRLGENFDRTGVISLDVKYFLSDSAIRLIDSQFDSSYKEEELNRCHFVSTHHGVTSLRKHYQKGAHRLLGICAKARNLMIEISECLQRYALQPLDESFDVIEIPGEIATIIFDCVKGHCFSTVLVDRSAFSDPTLMFIVSRGEGIGLWGETRHFRDVIFIGLDLLEELWKWKSVAENVAGDNHTFVDYVDSEVERFLFEVRSLLDCYASCQGILDKSLLKEHTRRLHLTEWFPSLDCSAHVSVTNQVYLHKILLTSYYGAAKLALHGPLVNPSAEVEALLELEDYLMRCASGLLRDLEIIAEAAFELQTGLDEKSNHSRPFPSANGSDNHIISPSIFMLNSIAFFRESYLKEPCFQHRKLPVREPVSGQQIFNELSSVPIVHNIVSMLEDEKGRYIEDFALSWSTCFPSVRDSSALSSICSGTSLCKSQRMAVKHWYRDVADALTRKLETCRSYTVFEMSQRNALIQASVVIVRKEFEKFESLLEGRTWSSRPLKWKVHDVEKWEELLKKSF